MRDGAGTNLKIRETALRLFVERGVDAVSVRDITDSVGIRPSTLYVHWRSRDDLVTELFLEGYARYAGTLAETAAQPGSFGERLAGLLRRVCGLFAEDPVLFRFLLLTQHQNLPSVRGEARNPIAVLQHFIAAGIEAGDFAAGDPALLTAAIVGLVVQAATFRHYGRIDADLPALADQIVALALKLVSP